MKLKNKKGVAEVISNIFGYLFLFFLTLGFWVIASHIQKEMNENLGIQASIDNSKTALLFFLRERIPGQDYTVAELVIESEYDFEKRKELRDIIGKKFDEKYFDYWNLKIEYPNKQGYGTNKIEYGHTYITQKIKTWIQTIIKTLISSVTEVTILPIDEKIVITTSLPSYETGAVNIELQTWVLISL
ncbi:MAG: hypothetical protein KKF89_05280 [Nanoarchaeota archaeon]|nr:hypothetical protein [Nanoarchaeota archaeon]MBU1855107.1 hypothetical protein [Nanoarchaeota archaeon]